MVTIFKQPTGSNRNPYLEDFIIEDDEVQEVRDIRD